MFGVPHWGRQSESLLREGSGGVRTFMLHVLSFVLSAQVKCSLSMCSCLMSFCRSPGLCVHWSGVLVLCSTQYLFELPRLFSVWILSANPADKRLI